METAAHGLDFDFCGKLRQNSPMSQSVRLSDELVNEAKEKAKLFHRSPPQQIEHWAAIGKILEPALTYGAQERVAVEANRENLDRALSVVDTPAGRKMAQKVIKQRSGKIVALDV